MSEKNSESIALEKIDMIELMQGLLKNLHRIILVFVLVFAAVFGYTYYRGMGRYISQYKATVTISVENANGYSSSNEATASQLGKVFPYILTSELLNDIVTADLGYSVAVGSVNVANIENTPLLDISAVSSTKEGAEEVINAVLKNYPEVARYVVGNTSYTIINPLTVTQTVTEISVLFSSLRKAFGYAFLAALAVGLFYSLAFHTIKNASDLRAVSNIYHLGTLPVYHKKKRKRSASAGINILESNAQSNYLETMRTIRTKLIRRLHGRKNQIIMVTSSVAGEGKSTISSNLAISLAQSGEKVLLIDCDVRNPSVQGVLNIKGNFPGITKVIEGKASFNEALVQYGGDEMKLHLLLGASSTSDQVELLGTEKMKELLETLRSHYDYIILDTAPSALLADAMMMTTYVDAAVYVIMSDYAERGYILKGIRELSETGIPIAGAVINAGKSKSSGSYGSSNYYYSKSNV